MIFISVVRDEKMYRKLVKNNPFNKGATFIAYDNNKENIPIPKRYNDFLDHYDYSKPDWFVFCHEDWETKQNWFSAFARLDKKSIYGTFGTKLKINGDKAKKLYIGRIEASNKDGTGWAVIGKKVPVGTQVETFDCMCIIIHSSLIQKHHIRFDEQLDWHHYAEELNIRLKEEYNIPSRILQINCRHWSYGVSLPNAGFTKAFNYVKKKFHNTKNFYSNTTIDEAIGPKSLKIKRILCPKSCKFMKWLYTNKITKSSSHLIRICGIPVYHKKIK
ncbi:MAG: hypothetical protein J6Y03_02365 [Alphaproteobacteria bacterium]|nr:hypothetical protein [Alphaproteobacteria bacterium]